MSEKTKLELIKFIISIGFMAGAGLLIQKWFEIPYYKALVIYGLFIISHCVDEH